MTDRARVLRVGGILLAALTVGLVAAFFALRSDDPGDSPTPAATAEPVPTTSPTDVETQVEQAYLHAWDLWAEALLSLDPSRLPDVLTGSALETITGQVETQRAEQQPVRIRVEHDYRIVIVDPSTASIEDRYINHNVRLDPETMQPVEEDPNHREQTTFTMRLVDGTWKIAEIIEYES